MIACAEETLSTKVIDTLQSAFSDSESFTTFDVLHSFELVGQNRKFVVRL